MKLTEKALTIELNISAWSGRRRDKQVTAEIEVQKEAKNAGNFNKLLVNSEFMRPYLAAANNARLFHYRNTLPWQDEGPRLLPSENYMHYKEGMIKLKGEFDREIEKFIEAYPRAIHEARLRLGKMFNEADYPSTYEIERKFRFKTTAFPVAESDFRVADLGAEEIEDLRKSVEKEIQERLNVATKDVWNRVKEQLSQMRDKFSNPDSRIYTSMFDNLKELVEVLPRLNVVKDPNLDKICEEMKGLLVEPDSIRSSDAMKAAKAKEVEDVMARFNSFF